ncbi:MAG: tripartite tricarboxylate transporter substrate binding protein [Burkholderiales bacterium]|jgi:tripartite-type tricarboxylate transporter receptor subunit TctC
MTDVPLPRRRLLRGAAAIASAALVPAAARAQAWPSKPIRVVVPYAAGGTSDILARTLGVRVGEALGVQLVVENRPGANGVLGTDLVAKAAPDGHTVLIADVGGLTSAPALVPNLPFQPLRDLAPVTMLTWSPHLLVVAPQVAARTVAELVAAAKARPGALNVATTGSGGAPHLAAALFARRAGLDWGYVPYKGGAQALNDLAAGQADLMFNGMLATLPFVQGGKLRALAVAGDRRWPSLPELPTVAELGFPGFMTGSWQGVLAPAGTPPAVVARIAAEFERALAVPEVAQRLAAQGAEPRTGPPAEFGAFLKADAERWAQLVKETGIKAE